MTASGDPAAPAADAGLPESTRARAGAVQLTGRDIRALVWCGDMYGIRADLLACLLDVSPEVVRQLHGRWRRAGLAETGRLGPGPGKVVRQSKPGCSAELPPEFAGLRVQGPRPPRKCKVDKQVLVNECPCYAFERERANSAGR